MKKENDYCSSIIFSIKFVLKHCIKESILSVAIVIIFGLQPVVFAYIITKLIQSITDKLHINTSVYYLLVSVILTLFLMAINALQKYNNIQFNNKITMQYSKILLDNIVDIPSEYFETEECQKKIDIAKYNDQAIINLFNNMIGIVQSGLIIISFIVFVFTIHPLLSISYTFFILIYAYLMSKQGFKEYNVKAENLDKVRRLGYITNVLFKNDFAKELRVYNYSEYLMKKWRVLEKDIRNKHFIVITINNILKSSYQLFSYIIIGLFFVFAGYTVLYGTAEPGIIAGLVSIIAGVKFSVSNLGTSMNEIKYNSMQLNNGIQFIDTTTKAIRKLKIDSVKGHIKLENISFYYPSNKEKLILNNINLEIFPGEKIALTGKNGAGKSTLAFIIAGIYKPTSGKIYLDGKLYNEYKEDELLSSIGIIPQDVAHYEISFKDNICFNQPIDENKYKHLLLKLGLSEVVENFTQKDMEQLGRSFADMELSGGQWQRIALARCFIKEKAKMFILDEPTSAMDPKIEYDLISLFNQLINNKTSILISHRLSCIQNVDKIIVMEEGNIIETGKHSYLIDKGKTYKELYQAQIRLFKDGVQNQ